MTSSGGPPAGATHTPHLPPGGQRRRLTLVGVRGQVARGRDFTRQALLDWYGIQSGDSHDQSTADDVLLLVSELLANAVMHAGGPQELLLHATPDLLRVEVPDMDPAVPERRTPHRPGVPGGHGLHIVERLSDHWGVTSWEGGKTVWLEIDSARLAPTADR
ncbi:ATP-binding protein [Kitasatospora mediocidica]|uniref:ATP-binding protein n=1 Tax=Kitasatospora mediocidica TaxID=58352 RepID=UPI0006914AEA|nr:ATP-binding protein [Kitasatospora mediocidica]